MLKKSVRELNLVRSTEPVPTVEIHADSVQDQGLHVGQIVIAALVKFAAQNPSTVATVYSYGTMSVSFHEHAWSEFLIVAGHAKVLNALAAAFETYPRIQSRYSDYIPPTQGCATYHVEQGRLWEVEDAFNWYSADPVAQTIGPAINVRAVNEDSGDDAVVDVPGSDGDVADVDDPDDEDADWNDDENIDGEDEDEADGEDESEDENALATSDAVPNPVKRKGRMNAARADAKVSSIRREIEKVFGLPEGSVALIGPDKERLKGNARIKTLRRRWDET